MSEEHEVAAFLPLGKSRHAGVSRLHGDAYVHSLQSNRLR